MEEEYIKVKVQRVIIGVSLFILISKFIAFFITNSVGILTDAMESIVNVVAEIISLFSLKWAAKPKDKEHPFGHGKMELISASIEGLLITIAGLLIIYEGIVRLFNPAPIAKLDIGIIVIAVAGVMNYIMGWYSIKMGKKHTSIALIAGGKHLQSDTYSTIGLVIGLLLLYFTDILWIDSALALIFGSIIIYTGASILRKTSENLLDKADTEILQNMVNVINENRENDWIDIHNTKVIRYGSYMYIDCDLTLPWYYNILQSHEATDKLKDALCDHLSKKIQLSVHSDPCRFRHCRNCKMEDCPTRKEDFSNIQYITILEMTQSHEGMNK